MLRTLEAPHGGRVVGVATLLFMVLISPAGCRREEGAGAPPPPLVTVAKPLGKEVIEWDEYTGNLEAPNSVDLRPRVSGLVVSSNFVEGQLVKAGQVLFEIDAEPYVAQLEARKAAADQAQATLALNQVTFRRYEQAEPGAAVSKQEYDTAKANVQLAQGQLDQAKALVREAQDNVDYCHVIAPIAGRVGQRKVTAGNLVTAGGGAAAEGTLLTTIFSVDPIYHYVNVDERSILKYRRLAAEGRRVSARDAWIPCFLQLLNEEGFPHQGVVDFVDNRVDPQTGTLRARGVFPNPDGTLTPGYFGRVRVPGSGRYRTLLVPDEAVGTDQDQKYLLSVEADGTVKAHPVKLGALFGTLRSIEKGIGPADAVIVKGVLRARPGSKVKVQETTVDASAMGMTAPGSPATQALPATRPFVTSTAVTRPTTAPVTTPVTAPETTPATAPTTGTVKP